MIILPAIDIRGGQCVRLYKGDFSTAHKVADDPMETAHRFHKAGAKWLHMVDLDGAKEGSPKNRDLFLQIAEKSGMKVELGGGIRDMETVEFYLTHGISRVILGSAAIRDPDFVKKAAKKWGKHIAVGIDARNEMVAAQGWVQTSDVHYIDLARQMEQAGVQCIIFTDISRDGTLSGPNLEQLSALNEAVSCDIIASGGIRDVDDIRQLKAMNLYGTICGKSLYEGTLDLGKAVKEAKA